MVKSIPNIFPHGRKFDQGVGKVRVGQATIVVALDGTGDTTSIQEGIDLLPNEGGEVFIKEGTYVFKQIFLTKDNVKITGTGIGTHLASTEGSEEVINIDANDCILSNFLINTPGKNATATIKINSGIRNRIENITSENGDTHFNIRGANTIITNCIFNTTGIAILVTADNILISDCIVNTEFGGFELVSNNSIISNCTITSTETTFSLGIQLSNSSNNIITGNNCLNIGGIGIQIRLNSDNNIISNNSCKSNKTGIEITTNTGDKNIIIGNICLSNSTAQITDNGTNTHPNGASGTNNLTLDDLNIIA